MIDAFIYGITLAIGLILPLGMQNIFIFNQGATQTHFTRALPSVVTAFICDAVLILCAVCSISLLVLTTPWLKTTILCLGIAFLSYMGLSIWKARGNTETNAIPLSIKGQIGFAASVSLFNPHAIIDTIGVIGTTSLQFAGIEKIVFILACMSVSLFWFLGLSIAGHYFRKWDKSGGGIVMMNKISALIIWMVAGYLLIQIF